MVAVCSILKELSQRRIGFIEIVRELPPKKLAVEQRVGTPPLFATVADVMNEWVGSRFANIGVGSQVKTNREQGIGIKALLRPNR